MGSLKQSLFHLQSSFQSLSTKSRCLVISNLLLESRHSMNFLLNTATLRDSSQVKLILLFSKPLLVLPSLTLHTLSDGTITSSPSLPARSNSPRPRKMPPLMSVVQLLTPL